MTDQTESAGFLRQPRFARAVWWTALILLAGASVALVLRATARGAGISPDSTVYISMARELLLPFGYTFVLQSPGDFPPLYPALLAAGGAISGDPATAARWINALLFGGNILLVGWILKRILPRSPGAALFGVGLMLTSVTMLTLHAMAWSEPTFLFFGLSGMVLLAGYLEHPQGWRLVLAAAAMALGAMDRYVGIALAFTGMGALILFLPGPLRRRIAVAALFGCIACLPLALWMTHQPTRRVLAFHPPGADYITLGYETISVWIVPVDIPFVVQWRPWIIAGLGILAAVGVGWVWRARTRVTPPRTLLARVPRLFYIVLLFALVYLAVNVLARIFAGPSLILQSRTLSPVFVTGMIVCISVVAVIAGSFRISPILLRLGMTVVALAVLWYSASAAWRYVEKSRVQGLGYASREWQASPTLAQLQNLPRDLMIYSNGSDAIYFLTARPVTRLPNKVDKMNLIGNQAYEDQLRKVGAELDAGRGVIVYLEGFPDRWYQPNEQDLMDVLSLHLVARAADGAIFR